MNDYNDNHVRETRIRELLYFYLLLLTFLLFLNLLLVGKFYVNQKVVMKLQFVIL